MKRITRKKSAYRTSRALGASAIFRGTKIERAGGERLWQHVDLQAVVVRHWKLLKSSAPAAQIRRAQQMALTLIRHHNKRGIWHGEYVYGIFLGRATPKALTLLHPGSEQEMAQLKLSSGLLRRLRGRFDDEPFHAALLVATIGPYVTQEVNRLTATGQVADAFFLHGLAAEMVEGLARFCQAQMPEFPDWARAVRYGPGSEVWPGLDEQRTVFEVLMAERIGVELTKTWQIVPEHSLSAIVLPAV